MFLILSMVGLQSCFEKDVLVPKHNSGDIQSAEIEMAEDYKYQVYFDLGTNKVISSNHKTDWDLAFESSDTGYSIIMNNSKFMKMLVVGVTNFYAAFDTTGGNWKFDEPSGHTDSMAIGKWADLSKNPPISYKSVYAIDLGMNEEGNQLGYRKIQLLAYNEGYYLKYAELDGGKEDSLLIPKDTDRNYAYFSFKNGGKQVNIEPLKTNWDLHFTQYSHVLYTDEGEAVPYLVLGVLLNPFKVLATVLKDTDFDNISFSTVNHLSLLNQRDIIGYEWKKYSFTNGTYEVNSQDVYIIQDTDGFLYKFRFISFYNQQGDKGFPTVELQKL